MDISVIIVSWNARNYLRECLESLALAAPHQTMEVIVVDNASCDGSPQMVRTEFPHVRLIECTENFGFARANNIGIRESHGRYVALINSDVHVLPGCLDQTVGFMDRHSDIGIAGPRILNADRTLQSSCRKFPSLWNNFCEASGLFRAFPRSSVFSTEHMLYFPHDRVTDVNVLVGCFWVMRREALETVGLLDEAFFIYSEDVDWCRRCWEAGWRVTLYPTAQAVHYRAASSGNDPARFAVEQQRAVLHYWDKYHAWPGRLGIRTILLVRYFVRYLISIASYGWKESDTKENQRRLLLSRACMAALLFGSSARKA